MTSFTPINGQATALIQNGLLTPPPTPPPVAVAPAPPTALIQFGLLTPSPSPPPTTPAMPPPPPPTPVTPAPTLAPARARPSATPRRPKWRRCPECYRNFSFKNFADHKKVHLMHGSEGALAHPCKQCKKHPERCYVAIHPEQLNTYSCACCLSSHKACSFKSIKVERQGVWAETHPFLLERENIPPKEEDGTSDSSVSTSDSSVNLSDSSVEETPLHMGRPWEL